MKSLKFKPGLFPSLIKIPGSKSYANRALILAALKKSKFAIHDLPESTDVAFLVDCLRQIGPRIHFEGRTCIVEGSFPESELKGCRVEVGEGGTTARFLATLLLRGKASYTLILGDRLKARPWDEFIELVRKFGGKAHLQGNELTIQGPVTLPDVLHVDCSRTTQFASGLQLAFSDQNVKVVPVGMDSSESYWKMTQEMIAKISGPDSYSVPLDWSSASYPLAFGALHQEIFFSDLFEDSFQADSKFLHVLTSLGAVTKTNDGLKIHPLTNPHSVSMDVHDCLDLVPALSFLLAHIPGQHELWGIENLAHKESHRLKEILNLLKSFERECSVADNALKITGSDKEIQHEKNLKMPDDHRMVMTGTLFLLHHSGGEISPADAVAKSYPRFFELLASSRIP